MKVIDPGHCYQLDFLDEDKAPTERGLQTYIPLTKYLTFVKREGEGYPGNEGHYPGTNIQEVLRACIDRVDYLDRQIPDKENWNVINLLRGAIVGLEFRAARRHGRSLENALAVHQRPIDKEPTCPKCGHIGCNGECHE